METCKEQPTEAPGVFDGCAFHIVTSKLLPESSAQILHQELVDNGAVQVHLRPDGSIKLENMTHIVAEDIDFPQYEAAQDRMINVVSPSWVQASLMKGKQVPLRPYTPDPRLIFSGINITTADIPTGDKDAIIGGVMAMGGLETSSLTKGVTHIVALSLDHPKCQQALEKKLTRDRKCMIVLPHWFDDCLKLGKRIDEGPYLFPDPEILHMTAVDAVRVPNPQHLEGATSARPSFLPTPTDTPSVARQLAHTFKGKKVMMSDDLDLGERLRRVLEEVITAGGGTMVTSIYKTHMYICQFRDGDDYSLAARAGKDVGNLAWLYHLITHNQWTSPFRRLLHYPIPRNGIPGFEKMRITISNYGGEARQYLENLVRAAGAEFTKSMKNDNTHLITARNNSEKCTAAQDWGINMINHLWIEESYAKCKLQPLTNPRYTHFPARTNLGEVIGQTRFDQKALEELYYPRHSESPEIPRKVMQPKNQNHELSSYKSGDNPANYNHDSPTSKRKQMPAVTPSRAAPRFTTPQVTRLTGVGKENETPSSTGSRGAKDRALSKLHDLVPDLELYEKERKRKGNGVWGGKQAADRIERDKINPKKRSASPASGAGEDEGDQDDDDILSELEGHDNKKQKTGRTSLPSTRMKLLITSYKRWVDNAHKEDSDRKKLRVMGILIVQNPAHCTHLVAPAMVRTQKFLTALAYGPPVLSTGFVDTCLESKEIPLVDDFLLKDTANEKKWKIKLKDAIVRAQNHPGKLLRGVIFYCTSSIKNGPETYRAIVEANGGQFCILGARRGDQIRPSAEGDDGWAGEPVYLITTTSPEEKKLWPKFEAMATAGKMEPMVVMPEFLLDCAMMQKIIPQGQYLQDRG